MTPVPPGYGVTLTGFQLHVVDHKIEHTDVYRWYPDNSVWAESKCGHILVRFAESAVAKKKIVDPKRCSRCDSKGRPPIAPETIVETIKELLEMAGALAKTESFHPVE